MSSKMIRRPEPEVMDDFREVDAYGRADFSDVNEAFVKRLIELMEGIESPRAVDLGTGPGDIPLRIARARPDWRIVGVDASGPMLSLARKTAKRAGVPDGVRWVKADAKDTGLPASSFDVVFSNSILHHISDPERFWEEVKRLAKPGAVIFLRDLARPADEDAARSIVGRYAGRESNLLKEEYYRSLLAAYTCAEVRAQLREAGLETLGVGMVSDRHLDVFGRLSLRRNPKYIL